MTTTESRLSNIRFKLPDAPARKGDARAPMKDAVQRTGRWMAAGMIVFAIALWSWRSAMTGDIPAMPAVAVQPGVPMAAAVPEPATDVLAPTSIPAAVAAAPPDARASTPGAAPALQIWLRGVLGTGPKGRAIVADVDGREYVVSVGSPVGKGASVQAIHDDHLLVMQGAKSVVVRLQSANAPVREPTPVPAGRVVTASGVSIDIGRLAAGGVESLTAAEKSAAIGANLVIDDSAGAVMAEAPGSVATRGESGQRFIKNKPR